MPVKNNPQKAAVLVPIINRTPAQTLLFTQRSFQVKHHKGEISFPGGSQDPCDLNLEATAVREAHEEIGLNAKHISIIGKLSSVYISTGFQVVPILAQVIPPEKFILKYDEVTHIFEIPLSVIINPDSYTQNNTDVCLHYKEHKIWGATGKIAYSLCLNYPLLANQQKLEFDQQISHG